MTGVTYSIKKTTELSKLVHKCKNEKKNYKFTLKILKREKISKPGTKTCKLCLKKALLILESDTNCTIKRTELMKSDYNRLRRVSFAQRLFC